MLRSVIFLLTVATGILNSLPVEAAKPNPKLAKRVSIKWEDQLVVEGLVEVAEAAGVKLNVDQEAIEEDALEDQKATLELSSVTLQSALKQIAALHYLRLDYNPDRGGLILTSMTASNSDYVDTTYSLNGIRRALTTETEFLDAIQSIGYDWAEIDGGEGEVIKLAPEFVFIKQSPEIHDHLTQFFQRAELALRGQAPPLFDSRTQRTLRKKFQFPEGDLSVEAQLQELLKGVNYLIDRESFEDEGIDLSAVRTPSIESDTVANHFQQLCEAEELDWIVRDGILIILSQLSAEEENEVRVYNVRKHIRPDLTPLLMAAKLENTPELGPWVNDGGSATCSPLGPLLVVWHNRAGHDKVAEALK